MIPTFFGYSEILNSNPQTEYFQKKVKSRFFKNAFFGGMTSKIEFEENWCYGYVLYYRELVKQSIHNFP